MVERTGIIIFFLWYLGIAYNYYVVPFFFGPHKCTCGKQAACCNGSVSDISDLEPIEPEVGEPEVGEPEDGVPVPEAEGIEKLVDAIHEVIDDVAEEVHDVQEIFQDVTDVVATDSGSDFGEAGDAGENVEIEAGDAGENAESED